MRRVLLAYSGGLDTSYLAARMSREGDQVTCVTVDCGGFDAAEQAEIQARALALGAAGHRFIDARTELCDRVVRFLIAGNVKRGGVYPLSVAAERCIQAEHVARVALAEGFDALAHGCTAAGNDQVRFEATLAVCAPGLAILAPVRDDQPSREDQVAYLREQGMQVPASSGRYSVNAGLWGLTIGGVETLDSREPLPEEAWLWTRGGGGERRLTIDFEAGLPVGCDGQPLPFMELIEQLNREGGQLGVGRGYHLGDTVLGIKGRIGFEAPAAEILLTAHRELEKLVLTEDQRFWKDHLADVYGRRLHQGLLHDPFMRDAEAFLMSSQDRVTGRAHVACLHGRVLVEGLESPYSLMAASSARYGERPDPNAHSVDAVGLARMLAEPGRLHARAGRDAVLQPQPSSRAESGAPHDKEPVV